MQDFPQEFSEFKRLIERYGVDEPFETFGHVKTYRYLYPGDGYRYWIVEHVLNRAKLDELEK